MRTISYSLVLSVALAATLPAHHSNESQYDRSKTVTVSGVVSRWDWSNPHAFLYIDVDEPSGELTRWRAQFGSLTDLRAAGWKRDVFSAGDKVTLTMAPSRDGAKRGEAKSVTLASGKKLDAPGLMKVSLAPVSNKPAPRFAGGHVNLGSVTGDIGYWQIASTPALVETTAGNIAMDARGQLANIGDAAKVAPFQPWARGLYQYRQRNKMKDDPMAGCLPPGGPRQFQVPYGIAILDEPARNRVFFMSGGGNRNWRMVPTDNRAMPDLEAETPGYYGFATGKWEGDALVVESAGFNERFWFSNGGLPHTEALKLTERITRPNYDTLNYEVTVNDPGAYTRPWTARLTLRWVANAEIDEYFCDDNNREVRGLTQGH